MTLYDLLKKISFILARDNENDLFQYMIHTMDHNGGFLRSRYCYWEKTITDFKCDSSIKTVLVTLRTPFDFDKTKEYYEDSELPEYPFTLLKMQIFLHDLTDNEELETEIKWSRAVGFSYPIKIDLINESFEILPNRNLSVKKFKK